MSYTVSKWQKASSRPVLTGIYQRRSFWTALFFNTEPEEHIYYEALGSWYIVHTCSMTGSRQYTRAPVQMMQWRGVEYE